MIRQYPGRTADSKSCPIASPFIPIFHRNSWLDAQELGPWLPLIKLLLLTPILLQPIYDWFTEGFDTPDLKDAKALLDEHS